jgi:hypothetical protein
MSTIRWGLGFFRLWLVLSVIWVVVFGYALREDLGLLFYPETWETAGRIDAPASEPKDIEKSISIDEVLSAQLELKAQQVRAIVKESAFRALGVVVLPPFLTLLAGLLVGWIGRGFLRTQHS